MNTRKGVIIHGEPGDSARAEGIIRAIAPTMLVLFILGICVGATLPTVKGVVGAVAIAVSLVVLSFVARRNLQGLSSWFKGAHGEELTGSSCAASRRGGTYFTTIPSPTGFTPTTSSPDRSGCLRLKRNTGPGV